MLSRLLKRVHTLIFGFLLIFSDLFSILIVLQHKKVLYIYIYLVTVTVCTSVGSTNVKLLCWVVILLPEKNKQKLDVLSEGPSSRVSCTTLLTLDEVPWLEMLSFCLFFISGDNYITTQHTAIYLQLLFMSLIQINLKMGFFTLDVTKLLSY
jgi:hypothetical protein